MKVIISFVLLLALIPCTVFAAQKANIKTMCKNAAMQKYVVRLEKNHKASVCTLESYRGEGEYCGSNFGEMWSQILDLNNDLNFDIILEDRQRGLWRGTDSYTILAGCGNGIFLRIMENEGLGDIVGIIGKTKKTRYSWASLSAKIYHPADDDYNAFYIQDARLVFDPDNYRYKIGNKGKISSHAIDGPSKTFINEPPDNYKISWGQFPSFISHPEKDGVEEACGASEFKDKIFAISYRVVEKGHAKWCKSQCIDNSVQEGSRVYGIVYEYINFDKTLVSPKMYKWKGRYFNNPDYSDWIVVDGNNEQQPFSKFVINVSCSPYGGAGYIRVLDGSFSYIKPMRVDTSHLWANIQATRQCQNTKTGKFESRTFVLKFDREKFEYGPPNGDPDLIQPCTDKEISLPFDSEARIGWGERSKPQRTNRTIMPKRWGSGGAGAPPSQRVVCGGHGIILKSGGFRKLLKNDTRNHLAIENSRSAPRPEFPIRHAGGGSC